MTDIEKDQLEDQLAQMTRWEGESTDLWQKAMNAHETQEPTSRFWLATLLHRRIPAIAAVITIVGGLVIASTLILPSLNDARVTPKSMESLSNLRSLGYLGSVAQYDLGGGEAPPGPPDATMTAPGYASLIDGDGGVLGMGGAGLPGRRSTVGGNSLDLIAGVGAQIDNLPPLDRHVIRKATIELLTDDVHATFLKATQLPSEARSEYLEASSLTGTGDEMQASLTLRVTADRLSEVLNQLRQLGEVRAEDSRGEDVTSQVVDLDARLRNERRIETELLELLDKRDDAPLREVLELRNHINRVRQSIERLTAQQQRLSRLVSLATILVIIRAEDAPAPELASDLGKYFSENVGASWTSGLRFLSDTIANLLRVLVGGVIWWVLLTVAILAITRHRRQAHLPVT